MKCCYICKQEKPLADFGKDKSRKNGLSAECKDCGCIRAKEYYARNREERRAKMKERYNKNLENCQEKARAYYRSEAGRESNLRAVKKYYKNHRDKCRAQKKKRDVENPEKYRAHNAIYYAIVTGKMKRSVFCESCGLPAKTEGHHTNYDKPLEVIWLCRKCHRKAHRKETVK